MRLLSVNSTEWVRLVQKRLGRLAAGRSELSQFSVECFKNRQERASESRWRALRIDERIVRHSWRVQQAKGKRGTTKDTKGTNIRRAALRVKSRIAGEAPNRAGAAGTAYFLVQLGGLPLVHLERSGEQVTWASGFFFA